MHSVLFGHVSALEIVGVVVYGLFLKAAAANTDELEQTLAQAIADALNAAHLSVKEAAYFMRLDESQLRKQLRAEPSQHVSLTRLIRLPFSFWLHFSPALISIIYRKRMQEFAQSMEDMRGQA